jgi:hypothetical protein
VLQDATPVDAVVRQLDTPWARQAAQLVNLILRNELVHTLLMETVGPSHPTMIAIVPTVVDAEDIKAVVEVMEGATTRVIRLAADEVMAIRKAIPAMM